MEKKPDKPSADRLTAPNAAAGSSSRRCPMVSPEVFKMHPEPAAASLVA